MSGWQPIETAPKDGTIVLLAWYYEPDGSDPDHDPEIVLAQWRQHKSKKAKTNGWYHTQGGRVYDEYEFKIKFWHPVIKP